MLQDCLLLRLLPAEVLSAVLGLLDIASIVAFRASSSACREIVDTGSQAIYESVAYRQYVMDAPCTAGDSGTSLRTIDYANRDELNPLRRAIARQRSASHVYDDATTWQELVRRRARVDRTWKTGKSVRRRIALGMGGADTSLCVWRFKVCPDKRMVLASTPSMRELGNGGVVLAVSLDAQYRQSRAAYCPFAISGRGYTHIEYTNGHLVFIDGEFVNVWTWNTDDIRTGPPGGMTLVHSTKPPARITSYKARWPYLVAEAFIDGKILLMDIATGDIVRQYTLDPAVSDMGRGYVELDQWSMFLANDGLHVINRENGRAVNLLDDSLYFDGSPGEPHASQVFIHSQTIQAVHHSLDGKHLVAIGDRNELIWFRDYRQQLLHGTKQSRFENVVVLRHNDGPEMGLVPLDNVCVENNRVVFSTRTESFPCVYFFELTDWHDHAEFVKKAPEIRLLSAGLPTGIDCISRIEMDSTSIYVTASGSPIFEEHPEVSAPAAHDLNFSWYTLTEQLTLPAKVSPVFGEVQEAVMDRPNMRDFLMEHRIFRNDCVLVYDFGTL